MELKDGINAVMKASPFGGILQKFLGETFSAGAASDANPIEAMVQTIDSLPYDINVEVKTASSTIAVQHKEIKAEK
jgi:hypothetical protein